MKLALFLFLLLSVFCQSLCSQSAEEKQQVYNYVAQKADGREPQNLDSDQIELGNGFFDHGVAVPVATSRGTVATVDDQGHNIILIWLYDHRGTYSLLLIDTESESSKQFFLPFTGISSTSILSNRNRYYTQFNGHFIEFNPDKRKFSFIGKTSAGRAMSMTEDDEGTIWAALSPNCNLVSYNPRTKILTDYGSINSEKARQLPRSIAADNKGWIYVTAGSPGKEKIVAFNPKTQKIYHVQEKAHIPTGSAYLLREKSGKVYGLIRGEGAIELQGGKYTRIEKKSDMSLESYITGTQALFHNSFPDGKRISDRVSPGHAGFLETREVTIKNPKTEQSRVIHFDYKTEGADLMGIAAGPDGMIIGGSTFPRIFFNYDPGLSNWIRHDAYGQFNALAIMGKKVFIGKYPHGYLLRWDTDLNWIPTHKGKKGTNPQYLTEGNPYVYRPNDLLTYPDNQTIIMAGRPSGKLSTGGLLFWDRKTNSAELLKRISTLSNQSTHSLATLPNGKILGGTTIIPGDSGGKRLAKEAKLYIMDVKTKEVEWSKAIIPGTETYNDFCAAANGLIIGVADRQHFFVFDSKTHTILKQVNLQEAFGNKIPYTQAQRSFIKSPEGGIYLLMQNGILKIDSEAYELSLLAKAPEKIIGGGAYLNGSIYYIGGGRNRIQSYTIPDKD